MKTSVATCANPKKKTPSNWWLIIYLGPLWFSDTYDNVKMDWFDGTDSQALIHGRMKDTMSTMRERERGNDKSRRRGRENDDRNRDVRTLLSPL